MMHRIALVGVVAGALFCSAATARAQTCVGDCSYDGVVRIVDLIRGVNIALGFGGVSECPSLDRDGDGVVRVADLITAVRNALNGCPEEPTPTAPPVAPTATPTQVPVESRCAVQPGDGVSFSADQPFCELLSSYRFFTDGATQQPNEGVLPYDLNTPLFSDYALKHRFVWMPQGVSAIYDETKTFDLPVGTVLIKTFAFPADFRDETPDERLIETRLLVHRSSGWDVVTYLWNAEKTEARRRVIGASIPVTFIDPQGEERHVNYQVPNTNQCHECHEEVADSLGPVGPKARHLNRDYNYADGSENQLARWSEMGYLTGAPDPAAAPRLPVFDDPETGTVAERARAYLDINCGNCHNPTGFARTSGLFLTNDVTNPTQLGVCKLPVAAGQGAGGRPYGITPGEPDRSILVYRMESTAPGVAMPELGRQTVHEEALEVIRAWIESLDGSCLQQ